MKKLFLIIAVIAVGLTSCLETTTTTTINADGSGTLVATLDISEMMKMMLGNKEGEDFVLDTTILMRNHSDTAQSLNSRQKELVRNMKINVKMDVRNTDSLAFVVQISTPFKDLKSFEELNVLMKQKEYDAIFDKAFNPDMFGAPGEKKENEDSEGKRENDNLFGSVFPAFYNCQYKKGFISCQVDSMIYNQAKIDLKAMDMALDGEVETNMLSKAIFINRIILPAKAKKIDGGSWVAGDNANELIQKGDLLDLYKHPEKYAYTIQY
jgi:hypothetical protein